MFRSRRSGAQLFWVIAAVLAWATAAEVSAQDASPFVVHVSVTPCPAAALEAEALVARLRVELANYGVGGVELITAVTDGATARFEVAAAPCEEGRHVFEARLVHVGTERSAVRSVDLTEVGADVHARTLALAMAELWGASFADLARMEEREAGRDDAKATAEGNAEEEEPATPTPVIQVPAVPQATDREVPWEPRAPTVIRRRPRTALGAAMVVRGFPSGRIAPIGGRLSLDVAPTMRLSLRIAAEGGHGTALDPFGTIDINYATAGLTLALVAAAGEHALLTVGPRVAAGFVNARGHPSNPATPSTSGFGSLLLVGGVVEVDVRLTGALSLRFGVGVDAVVAGHVAYVSSVAVAGITDGGLGAFLGLALEL